MHPVHDALLLRRLDNLLRVHTVRDEIRAAGQPFSEGETRYQQLFDAATDAIFIVDPAADTILDVNRRAVKWLGFSREDLLRMPYSALEVPDESGQTDTTILMDASSSGHFVHEMGFRTASGDMVPGEVSSRLLVYDGRRTLLNFVRDVTRRYEVEQAEREQRRLAGGRLRQARRTEGGVDRRHHAARLAPRRRPRQPRAARDGGQGRRVRGGEGVASRVVVAEPDPVQEQQQDRMAQAPTPRAAFIRASVREAVPRARSAPRRSRASSSAGSPISSP